MYELHGWLNVKATYLYKGADPKIDEHTIMRNADELVKRFTIEHPYTRLRIFHEKDKYILDVMICADRRTDEVEAIIDLFGDIETVANGSYGIIYIRDDENADFPNEFEVFVFKRGKCLRSYDRFLSPCVPELEDAPPDLDDYWGVCLDHTILGGSLFQSVVKCKPPKNGKVQIITPISAHTFKTSVHRLDRPPKFTYGDKAYLADKSQILAKIVDIKWHFKEEKPYYILSMNGVVSKRKFYENELVKPEEMEI